MSHKNKRLLGILIAMFVACFPVFSQGLTTQGTDFWLTFGNSMREKTYLMVELQIRVVAIDQAATGTISFTNLGTSVSFSVAAGQVYNYILSDTEKQAVYNDFTIPNSNITSNLSVHITSSTPVMVYALNQGGWSTDATNILPEQALGTNYYHISAMAYAPYLCSDAYGVIATQNNTQIYHNGTLSATLNRGQVYYRTSAIGGDMTGAHIISDKPVAFFALNQAAIIPANASTSDNLFQQLAPVNTWGKNFFAPVSRRGKDFVRIMVSQNGTNITKTGGTIYTASGGQSVLTNLNAGEWVELEISRAENGCYIQADKPVGVCTYLTSTRYNHPSDNQSDPAQAWLPPLEQKINSALIASFIPTAYTGLNAHYALVVTPTATKNNTTVKIGAGVEQALSGGVWYDHSSGYSFYDLQLANSASVTYLFKNQGGGLIVMGYGTGQTESYYYWTGAATRDLDASFYVNNIHYQDLAADAFCAQPLQFRAEIEGDMSTAPGHLKWFINDVEETVVRDQLTWSKTLAPGTYQLKMGVLLDDDITVKTIEASLRVAVCDLILSSTGFTSVNCVQLQWTWAPSTPVGDYGYTLYQWNDALPGWQTTSTNYDRSIKVLNVYPDILTSNTLQTWMHDPTIGLGKINVTPETITNFNANPNSYLKNAGGEYQYDVIMFGSYDANNRRDLSNVSAAAVEAFLDARRGVLFGHDTQTSLLDPYIGVGGGQPNFVSLRGYVNLDIDPLDDRYYLCRGSTNIKVVNDGFLLKYPHLIPYNINLTIPFTHTTGQMARGIVWMNFPNTNGAPSTLANPEQWDSEGGTNNFYLTTWNNAAMIQTGHSNGAATDYEKKILANTLWYLAQFTSETTADVCSVPDLAAPETPAANRQSAACNKIDISSFDYGTEYKFYVKATNSTNPNDTTISNVLVVENKTGLRGFFISEDNNPSGVPDSSNPATTFISAADNVQVSYTIQNLERYVHIQAVDYAGNLSVVTTLQPVPCNSIELFIPDVFTPNGDGINDYFYIVGLHLFEENELIIVNKRGKLVYSKKNYDNTWDGDGQPDDIYYYQLKVATAGGAATTHKGYVYIKRK